MILFKIKFIIAWFNYIIRQSHVYYFMYNFKTYIKLKKNRFIIDVLEQENGKKIEIDKFFHYY